MLCPMCITLCACGTVVRVRELLLEDPLVSRIEDAPQREGGQGCTVAVLR